MERLRSLPSLPLRVCLFEITVWSMKLNAKIGLFSALGALVIIVCLVLISMFSFRQFYSKSAEVSVRTAAEIVRVALTESMVNNVIDKREALFRRLSVIDGLREVRVVRGPEVVRQFGAGLKREYPRDEFETQVLASGQPRFEFSEIGGDAVFRGTIPFVATDKGAPDCLSCHKVPINTVLGAVTLTLSVDNLKSAATEFISILVGLMLLAAVVLVLGIRRMLRPLVTAAEGTQRLVQRASEGDFSGQIKHSSNDEVGQITADLNRLMQVLQHGLGTISQEVAELIRYDLPNNSNLLGTTIEMVNGLVEVSRFKQSIEEDETKTEVYQRLVDTLTDEFHISRFSIYETEEKSAGLDVVMVDGVVGADCRWCDPEVLVRAESCRAKRTGHIVDSVAMPKICSAFLPGEDAANHQHICIPVLKGGTVVQLVVTQGESYLVQQLLPFIHMYLREAAPVIEAKRLMDSLRETNLRDPMTGLHNRRFLEEYAETLTAAAKRRETRLSILMLDVDYFKKVNDTYGHECGDKVLKKVAQVLFRSVRALDFVIRYGGEEFVIILQDTQPGVSQEVAEKIRIAIEATEFDAPNTILKKTISIGIADYPDDSDTFWRALKYSDVALYKAKEQGRNRVVHFESEMWTEGEY